MTPYVDDNGGDRYSLRMTFLPITDPIAKYPVVWRFPTPHASNPDVNLYPIGWWDKLYIGFSVPDTTLWCNTFNVTYSEEITEYEDGKISDVEYRVEDKWYSGEQVGWMYALYTLTNIVGLGLFQGFWSKQWRHTFEGFYHARRYVAVTEYQWTRKVNLHIVIGCDGIVQEYSKECYPTVRPPETDGRATTLVQEFDGNVNKGDPKPTSDSWIGTTVDNIGGAVDWAADNGMPLGPTVTVMSPDETTIQPIKVSTASDITPVIPEDSHLSLTSPEELLTSYNIIVELNDPDGETAIAAYPSNTDKSNVEVALKGSATAGLYSHPGYTIKELYSLQSSGTPISREEFQNTFGIVLPAGVSECIITNISIDSSTEGSLYGDTSYTPGLYVGSSTDKFYYPSNAREGTITVMHR